MGLELYFYWDQMAGSQAKPLQPERGETMNHDATFRERVHEFWDWFPTQADQLASAVKSDNPQENLESFFDQVREKIGGLAWAFGPGSTEDTLSFTVTGEGERSRQLLAQFWSDQAVPVPGWDFYCARQATPVEHLKALKIEVGEATLDVDTMMIATEVDEENQTVNLQAWHPAFENLDDNDRYRIAFLLLDESLGEYGTQTKLGKIELEPGPEDSPLTKPLIELPMYLASVWAEKGWEETSPLENYTGYQAEPSDEFVRSDTIVGYTNVPEVAIGYLDNDGILPEDPVEGTGAAFWFVKIDRGELPQDHDPMAHRSEIELEVARRLAGGGGCVIGGATGTDNSYVDVVIFDGDRSIAAIREAVDMTHNGDFEILPFFPAV